MTPLIVVLGLWVLWACILMIYVGRFRWFRQLDAVWDDGWWWVEIRGYQGSWSWRLRYSRHPLITGRGSVIRAQHHFSSEETARQSAMQVLDPHRGWDR